jgi:hypothetical protein
MTFSDTCKLVRAGYDGGNGLTKASFLVDDRREFVRMPSYLYQMQERDTIPVFGDDGAVVVYREGHRKDLEGTRWLIGSTAYNNQPRSRVAVAENRAGKVEFGLQMFLGCIARLGLTRYAKVKVAASVHDRDRWAKELVGAFNGIHRLILNGTEVTLEITAGCVEEGYGAVYYLQNSNKINHSKIGIVDFGYRTTLAKVYERAHGGFSAVRSSEFILDMGVRDLVVQMAQHDSLTSVMQGRVDIETVRSSLELSTTSGLSRMCYGLTRHDMTQAYRESVNSWASVCLAQARNALKDWEAQAQMYAIGGGTKLPGVAAKLSEVNPITGSPFFYAVDNAHIVNAEGLLIASGAIK